MPKLNKSQSTIYWPLFPESRKKEANHQNHNVLMIKCQYNCYPDNRKERSPKIKEDFFPSLLLCFWDTRSGPEATKILGYKMLTEFLHILQMLLDHMFSKILVKWNSLLSTLSSISIILQIISLCKWKNKKLWTMFKKLLNLTAGLPYCRPMVFFCTI